MKSLLLAAILALVANAASAHEYKLGSLEIKHPWTRATPKGATVAGGYMNIINHGTTPDRLVGGLVACGRQVRDPRNDDGQRRDEDAACSRMASRSSPARPSQLKPDSYHVMFVGLKQPFEKGKRVKGALEFEKAGKVDVEFAVEAIGAMAPGHEGMGGMDHGDMHQGH